MNTFNSYETERLILIPTSEEDSEFVLELFNTPKWIAHIGDRKVKTVEDATRYIKEKIRPQMEKLGYGNFTVLRKSDHMKIGSVGLYQREGLDVIDIGFAFLPAYEQKGYAFESASKLKALAKEAFHLKKISAITTKENVGSQKLLEKLGLGFIKWLKINKEEEELMYYELDLK